MVFKFSTKTNEPTFGRRISGAVVVVVGWWGLRGIVVGRSFGAVRGHRPRDMESAHHRFLGKKDVQQTVFLLLYLNGGWLLAYIKIATR